MPTAAAVPGDASADGAKRRGSQTGPSGAAAVAANPNTVVGPAAAGAAQPAPAAAATTAGAATTAASAAAAQLAAEEAAAPQKSLAERMRHLSEAARGMPVVAVPLTGSEHEKPAAATAAPAEVNAPVAKEP